VDLFKEKIVTFLNDNIPEQLPGDFPLKIVPLEKANLVFGKQKEFMIFSGIAVLILLIVAINYMNLSTANFNKRMREMGVRKIVGATPGKLGKQLFWEALLQTFTALICALFLVELILPQLKSLFDGTVRIGYGTQPVILLFLLGLGMAFSILVSFYPIFVLTRGNPSTILRDPYVKGRKRSNVLLVTTFFQFTVSICLLISTMVVQKQVRYAKRTPPGLEVPLNPQIGSRLFEFFDELESNTGVLETTAGQANPINEDYKTNIDWPGRDPATFPLVRYTICLPDFASFFRHEIIQGRSFSDSTFNDSKRFLVNEAACKLLGKEDPIGQKINMWGTDGEIIGVIRNFHHTSVRSEIMPHVINIDPIHYRNLRFMFIRLAPEGEEQTLKFIKDTFGQFAGEFPFTYEYLTDEVDRMYARDIRLAKILGSFSFLAILISCLGIYGLARYSAEKKARDLTIRRVFGASFKTIVKLSNIEMLRRTGFSVVLAIPLSYFLLERWLREFAFRTDLSWWIFALGGTIGIVITIASTMLGIWKSLKQAPTEVLRQT
jgi:putative ABC transport system permease protein